jgi:hypothetical protein
MRSSVDVAQVILQHTPIHPSTQFRNREGLHHPAIPSNWHGSSSAACSFKVKHLTLRNRNPCELAPIFCPSSHTCIVAKVRKDRTCQPALLSAAGHGLPCPAAFPALELWERCP